jgi:hypothetical protein
VDISFWSWTALESFGSPTVSLETQLIRDTNSQKTFHTGEVIEADSLSKLKKQIQLPSMNKHLRWSVDR